MKKCKLISIILLMLCLSGCQSKQQSTEANYHVDAPESIVSDLTSATTYEDKVEVVNGYEKLVLNEALGDEGIVYIPYIKSRVMGVTYFYDDERTSYRSGIYKSVNRPNGCGNAKVYANGFFAGHSTIPDFVAGEKLNNPQCEILEGYDAYSETEDRFMCILADNMDVRAVSLALYEDFYKDLPQMSVKIYGIDKKMWNANVGEKIPFYYSDYDSLLKACEKVNYDNCKLIHTEQVSKTGVYYIDYDAMKKTGDYVQFLVCFEFDRSVKYTYNIHGSDNYVINSQEEYAKWKKENIDKFISE